MGKDALLLSRTTSCQKKLMGIKNCALNLALRRLDSSDLTLFRILKKFIWIIEMVLWSDSNVRWWSQWHLTLLIGWSLMRSKLVVTCYWSSSVVWSTKMRNLLGFLIAFYYYYSSLKSKFNGNFHVLNFFVISFLE